jgi:hypothetical protein
VSPNQQSCHNEETEHEQQEEAHGHQHEPAKAQDRLSRALHRRRGEGRIVWANRIGVKIRWVDGEQVTWRRDARAGKPIEILDALANRDGSVQAEVPRHVLSAAPEVEEEPSQTDG